MTQNNLVKNLLRLEVVRKGQTATFAFIGFAILSFVYGFGCVRLLPLIRITSISLFVLTLIRYFLYKKIIKKGVISEKEWIKSVVLITLNGFGFGLVLWLAAFELKMSGVHFVVVTTLVAGLVGSSMVSLAYFAILFVPFQIFLLLPQALTIVYLSSTNEINHWPMITLYIMYFLYQTKQFISYNKDLVKLFTYQVELEEKNMELIANKNLIEEQTSQLIHASRLAVVGEISAGIAHEINNPLAIISSSSYLLNRTRKISGFDDVLFDRYLTKINKSTDRIASIVKGLKYLSNQNDRAPRKNCYIQKIMEETTPFCIDHLNSFNIDFKMENIPDLMINCHPVQISQVLINLLKNASDALVDNEVADKWITVSFQSDEEYFYFIISNSGEKISHDVANRIFNPFYTTKNTGTGLGLSISQTIMKDHGGELYVDINNYNNTTFVMKHPIEPMLH